jgi:hypothetical protein
MPLPKPREGESQDDFVSRCIPATIEDQDLDPDNEGDREQATAICGSQWREDNESAANSRQLGFACNVLGASVRTETRDGRDWLIAPVVALTSGVRNHELVPASEVLSHPQAWNGRPVVVYHPQDNGQHVSANDPSLLEKQQIGQLFNVTAEQVSGQAKLKGELWIDIQKARQVGQDGREVLTRLRNQNPLEVSTAYFRDIIATQGLFDGTEYGSEARDIKPDHLAVLPQGEGACSWADGCGAPRVNQREGEMQVNLRSEARRPEYSGTTSGNWSAPDWSTYVRVYYEQNPDAEGSRSEAETVDSAPQGVRSFAAATSLLGDADAETFDELVYFPVVEPGSQDLNENALRAVIGGRSAQADAPESAVESARRMAYRLLNEEFDADLEFEPLSGNQSDEEESQMNELIERIVQDGRLGLNAEELEERDEQELQGMLAVLEALPEQEPEDEEDDMETEPVTNEQDPQPEPEPQPEPDPRMEQLLETVEELGGVQALENTVRNYQNTVNARRERLITSLAANEACTFDEDQLGRMDEDQLVALDRMLTPVDYTGMGVNAVQDGEEELAMPQIDWGA